MQRKIFRFKLVNKESNCILSIDYTSLSSGIISQLATNLIKLELDSKCKLLFIGRKNCRLTLEDVYNLTGLFQSVVSSTLVWDIIDDCLNPKDSEDLDGYLIIDDDLSQ
ncbi:hypothetical protein [Bacteroides xylanisolvens]|jgi:hypothetical protein|uniref:hypothetical protein n=1 Tax=Bacteroides xylanisolvens TaxID=371601 RepID=UPI0023A97FA1|nr:hypothetical protein [Bacteroides xylanisolvens]MDE5406352.1 hypothetical protein [Bacteroides xylanisolvens]